ncbi:UdgX family uracil-DNA binding protein [Catellatospora sp. KI3]|uniref:UdgX family uracil-DNA binding protein n=1 Tax=Catellatospora sp. KI3 TaxID=3041620 RepID=UPI002482F5E0|nr:UdgX family uracil-DNA binding protein [Catellatospora sp. KI3]MDI1462719.1 UdgX family uracil-DNA binding protein [Catellatospora sp. KI3]
MATRTEPGAEEFVPAHPGSVDDLRAAAGGCRGCHLYRDATQTVFGAGPGRAAVVLVGEQPGDVEDRRGAPFVGPAGKVLDRAMAEAGLARTDAYLTNAVKHFKHRDTGKRRIHQTPTRTEVVACLPWLVAELELLRPRFVVALGGTAVKALLGPAATISGVRGQLLPWPDAAHHPELFAGAHGRFAATIHPSAVLRAEDREALYQGLVADLALVAHALGDV